MTFFKRISKRLNYYRWKLYVLYKGKAIRRFILPDNSIIDYPLKSAVGSQLFLKEFELSEIAYLKSVIKPGDIVLDIGANAGIYSVMMSKWVGASGHVYSFEIGPNEIDLFNRNIRNNHTNNVTLLQFAVSESSGRAKFALSHDGAMNSLLENDHPEQRIKEWIDVDTITLTDAATRFNIDRVDVIKMDVEGAEKLVFEGGMKQIIKWKPKGILFESSDLTAKGFGYTVVELIDFLIDQNFTVHSLRDGNLIPLSKNGIYHTDEYNFVAIFK